MRSIRTGILLGAVLLSARAFADFGDPLRGLTAEERAAFEAGEVEVSTAEDVDEGLGPVFHEASRRACPLGPGVSVGGTNQRLETRFGRMLPDGTFDPLAALG